MAVAVIKRDDPVREVFSGCSSGTRDAGYYNSRDGAIRAFDAALAGFDYHFDRADNSAWSGTFGRREIDIYVDGGDCVGKAIIYYYRTESDRWEMIGYIA